MLVAVPAEFVNTASYFVPLSADVVPGTVSVVDVAPVIGVNDDAPGASDCHCTVGVGVPEAAAVNVAVAPTVTV